MFGSLCRSRPMTRESWIERSSSPPRRPHFGIVTLLAAASVLFAGSAYGQSLVLTFDDGPNMADPVGLSPGARSTAILRQLADAHLKSILFVTRTNADPERNELIRQWGVPMFIAH